MIAALRRKLLQFRIAWTQGRIEAHLALARDAGAHRERLRARLEELDRRAARRLTQREINRIAKASDRRSAEALERQALEYGIDRRERTR